MTWREALPFPLSDVSNGEWCPRPPNDKQRAAAALLIEEADRRAKRLGMSRRAFLRTAAGTATAFMVLNTVHGLEQTGDAAPLPVTPEQCDDPVAARSLFEADYFVMDVQLHHVDLERFNIASLDLPAFPRSRARRRGIPARVLSQLNMVKEVFVDSETAVGVISGVPNGVPLPVETMAQTRDLVNELAGSRRALSQAMCDPRRPPGSETSIDSLEHQVRDLGARALKCYTGSGEWWLDDEDVAYPMLEEASRLGLRVINVHKGLPGLLPGMAELYVQSRDLPKVSRDWPRLTFVAYHSGYFQNDTTITEFLDVVRSIQRRRNVYAEIGSSLRARLSRRPDRGSASHRLTPAGARSRAHRLGHRLDLVGLAAVADRGLQGAHHPAGDAGGVRLPAAHRARQAPDPRSQRRAALPRPRARGALRHRRRSAERAAHRAWAAARPRAPISSTARARGAISCACSAAAPRRAGCAGRKTPRRRAGRAGRNPRRLLSVLAREPKCCRRSRVRPAQPALRTT